MAKQINGITYYLIDVVYDEEIIYDVLQNDNGEVIYIPSGLVD